MHRHGGGGTAAGGARGGARSSGPRAAAIAILCVVALAATLVQATAAAAESPLSWSPPTNIDATHELAGVSCPSAGLCVAVDRINGDVVTTTDPTGGAGAWTVTFVNTDDAAGVSCALGAESSKLCVAADCLPKAYFSTNPTGGAGEWTGTSLGAPACGLGPVTTGVSCASTSVCVISKNAGEVVTTATATGGSSAWHAATVDGGNSLNAVSCPTTSLCVAVDNVGNVVTSQSPLAGAGAWSVADVDGTHYLRSVSCSAEPIVCVAGDEAGNVVTSTDPAGGAGAWTVAHVDGSAGVLGMSCPTATLCVGVDNQAGAIASTSPTSGVTAWTREVIDSGQLLTGVSCASSTLCVATDWHGNVVEGTAGATPPPPPPGSTESGKTPGSTETSKGTPGTPETHVIAPLAQILSTSSNGEGQTTVLLSCAAVGGECGPLNVQLAAQVKVQGNKVVGVLAKANRRTRVKRVVLASATLSIPAGQRKHVTLELNATGRSLLARFKRLSTQLRVVSGGHVLFTRTVELTKPAKRRRRHG